MRLLEAFLTMVLLFHGDVAAKPADGPKAEVKKAIRFPDLVPAPLPPAPQPAPTPSPISDVTNIPADEIYVIDSDVELFVLCSPAELVTVTVDAGPLPIRAKFVGGS